MIRQTTAKIMKKVTPVKKIVSLVLIASMLMLSLVVFLSCATDDYQDSTSPDTAIPPQTIPTITDESCQYCEYVQCTCDLMTHCPGCESYVRFCECDMATICLECDLSTDYCQCELDELCTDCNNAIDYCQCELVAELCSDCGIAIDYCQCHIDTPQPPQPPPPPPAPSRLPVIHLNTEGNAPVISRTEYIHGNFEISVCGNGIFPTSYSIPSRGMRIRGRGHSSWNWPKTPYRINLDSATSLFGMAPARNWILRPNYSDRSLMRDHIAFTMGQQLENLAFVPGSVLVDVYFNGNYMGVYILTERVEVRQGRVELTNNGTEADTGFLVEIGGGSHSFQGQIDEHYFNTTTFVWAWVIYPHHEVRTQEQMQFITDFVQNADTAVVTLANYEDYICIPSLIDWFILHELTFNLDSSFRRSCFFTKDAGGLLRMGPPWDFDLAFGNIAWFNTNPNSWASVSRADGNVQVTWMDYLLTCPRFTAQLRERWNQVGNMLLQVALNEINATQALIAPSAARNFERWDILGRRSGFTPANIAALRTFDENVQQMRDFLTRRKAWMDNAIARLP